MWSLGCGFRQDGPVRVACISTNHPSGFVRPAKRKGKHGRGLWGLWVCLPPEPATGTTRVVPMPPVSCEEVGTILKAQGEHRLAHGKKWREKDLVLPKRAGTPMSTWSLGCTWWTRVVRRSVQPHLPMHGLRDSFANWVDETCGVVKSKSREDDAQTLGSSVHLASHGTLTTVLATDQQRMVS